MASCIDVALAQQTSAVCFPKLLSEKDLNKVRACHREELERGVSRTQYPGKLRCFLGGDGFAGGGLQKSCPAIVKKLLRAAATAKEQGGWAEDIGHALDGIDIQRLKIRVVEYWEYDVGGGLVDDYHYDLGSIVTLVCLVDKDTSLSGGVFRTFEANGTHAEHHLERGDVLCLLSHKFHNVTPVVSGYRHSLVFELWQGGYDEECARMASDDDSCFVACGGVSAAQHAVFSFSRDSIELIGITSREDIAECLTFVEEVLEKSSDSNVCLRGLSFASCCLDSADFRRLGQALQTSAGQKLTAFGISKNAPVDCDSWGSIFSHIPERATWLDFGDNGLSDADVAVLCNNLCAYPGVDRLYLDGNKIHDLCALSKSLPESSITDLDLGDNNIDDASVGEFATVLHTSVVSQLVLGKNPITALGVAQLIKVLPLSRIEVLYLDETGADDACLASLSKVLESTKLFELHMDSTQITDVGVRDLIPHLEHSRVNLMDVAGNGLSDDTVLLLQTTCSTGSDRES